ncbi:ATP-binding cassette domain-containing protein [Frankia sp. Mgl5]|uniref:ATP-binding cassette domain-containing protein n=1 Tax=Frankia sp. Mgl5 TaxID=2933793 RepID=UPI00200CB159|nr:ATP-binding cassette domain-containing protein [Frankia sp. Mgl5]MCK9932688.1 ATP-binding cassette domain-containing protein [Frankia sp. Mgl5]
MIELRAATKCYGRSTAVDRLEITIVAGKVTGFLGPNGSGKSTTMRMIMGLDRPTSGEALVNGRRYADLREPLRSVGALLDAGARHPARSARAHLLALARYNGIPGRRVDEVLGLVGLSEVAGRRAGSFSLGMSQRLGIAAALLGDPEVLLFDEPVNGLDTDGVRWVRQLMRSFADEGRTVFVSSHLMSEMQLTADHLVVIGRGRLVADAPLRTLVSASSRSAVRLRSPDAAGLAALRARMTADGYATDQPDRATLMVHGGDLGRVGDLAHAFGLRLHELGIREPSLEEAYVDLTGRAVEYSAPVPAAPDGPR